MRGVANFLSDPASPFELTLHRMMTTKHLGDAQHPVVASAAREVLNKSDNERSGVLSTAMSFLGLYRDPTVAEVTSRCDWRIADLIAAEHPVPGLRAYVLNPIDRRVYPDSPIDGFSELWFDSLEDAVAAFDSPIGKAAFIDVPNFVDAVAVTYVTEIKKL
ncbi:EthD family reductase [Yersinia enterocolitica]|uniref:EthD family reductase n=1 Tax=Yersinia enterocolitica TaxID=630 RepID=UPI003F430FCB